MSENNEDVALNAMIEKAITSVETPVVSLPQHGIDAIAKGVHARAFEKGKALGYQEALKEREASNQYQQEYHAPPTQSIAVDPEKVKNEVLNEIEGQRLFDDFHRKVEIGVDGVEDYKEVIKNYNPQAFQNISFMAAKESNTAEILYDLSRKPEKMAEIELLYKIDPGQAKRRMLEISGDLKRKREKKNTFKPTSAPLNKINPSVGSVNSGGNSEASIERLKSSRFYMS